MHVCVPRHISKLICQTWLKMWYVKTVYKYLSQSVCLQLLKGYWKQTIIIQISQCSSTISAV